MNQLKRLFNQYEAFCNQRVSGASLSLFRALFGVFVLWDSIYFFYYSDIYFPDQSIHITYPGLLSFWPNTSLFLNRGLLVLLGFAGIALILGFLSRIASACVVAVISHLFLRDATFYLNHLVLTGLIALSFLFVPVDRYFSLRRSRSKQGDGTIALYELGWVVGLFFFSYVVSAIEKIRPEWWNGHILDVNFGSRARSSILAAVIHQNAEMLPGLAIAVFILELLAPVGLVFRRTRVMTVLLLGFFHLFNHLTLNIGLFSYLMAAAMVLYFSPDWPKRVFGKTRLGARFRLSEDPAASS